MFFSLKKKDKFSYIEEGEGKPIVLLHGLMGELSNFSSLTSYFSQRGYKVYAPELPLYSLPIISTNINNIAKHVTKFIETIIKEPVILVGNSLGGHIGLVLSHKPLPAPHYTLLFRLSRQVWNYPHRTKVHN